MPPVSSPGDARRHRRTRLATTVIAWLAILVALPALPSAWASLIHRSEVRAPARVILGYVTVEGCSRGSLHFDWSCRGRFHVNDPMAEPYRDVTGVTVANDPRHYRAGDTLDIALPFQSRTGYRWGTTQDAKTVGLWLGVLLCIAASVAAFSPRRLPLWGSRLALLVGAVLIVGLTPVV